MAEKTSLVESQHHEHLVRVKLTSRRNQELGFRTSRKAWRGSLFPSRGSCTNGSVSYQEWQTGGESHLRDLSPGLGMKTKAWAPQRSRVRRTDGGMHWSGGCRAPCQESRRESNTRAEPTAAVLIQLPKGAMRVRVVLGSTSAQIKLLICQEKVAVTTGFEIHQNNPLRNYRWYLSLSLGVRCSVVSDSLRPHGLQPTRLLCPWDSPGNNTGVGYHSLLQGNLPNSGMEPRSPAVQADSSPSEPSAFHSPTYPQLWTHRPSLFRALPYWELYSFLQRLLIKEIEKKLKTMGKMSQTQGISYFKWQ